MTGDLPRRYARAIFSIAIETDQVSFFAEKLDWVNENFFKSATGGMIPGLVLSDPKIPSTKRVSILREVAQKEGLPDLVRNFLCVLVQKERFVLFPQILKAFQELSDEGLNILRVEIQVAQQVDQGVIQKIETVIAGKTAKTVKATVLVNPALLGGLVLRMGNMVFDGSFRRDLERLGEHLLKEAV